MSDTAPTTEAAPYRPRLKDYCVRQVVPQLLERYGLKSPMAAPRLVKVVLNMGIGEAVADQNAMTDAVATLRMISGQQPVVTHARQSEAGFRVRQGVAIGCKVTLRGARMYEFLDRLISIALPRVRDFRGLSVDSFDGSGNYSLGIRECVVFPEIDLDKLKNIYGLDVTIVTTAETDQQAMEFLSLLGMPFRR